MGRWLSECCPERSSADVSTLSFAPRWNRSALAVDEALDVGERGVVDIAWRLITSSTPRIVPVRLLSAMQSSEHRPSAPSLVLVVGGWVG